MRKCDKGKETRGRDRREVTGLFWSSTTSTVVQTELQLIAPRSETPPESLARDMLSFSISASLLV